MIHINRVSNQEQAEAELARLQGIIADALAALSEGRYGDIRRILKTGVARPVISITSVKAREDGR